MIIYTYFVHVHKRETIVEDNTCSVVGSFIYTAEEALIGPKNKFLGQTVVSWDRKKIEWTLLWFVCIKWTYVYLQRYSICMGIQSCKIKETQSYGKVSC